MATGKKQFREAVAKASGDVLRQIREGRGLSQQDLAFESDLDRTYISLLERGLRQPSLTTLILLAPVLSVDPADLVRKIVGHPLIAKAKR